MVQGLCIACIKRQCLCSLGQEKESCSLRFWRWTSILTVTEPANTTLPFLMMSSAPYFWMRQTTATWRASSSHGGLILSFTICLIAIFTFQFYELLMQLFSCISNPGKKSECTYTLYCTDNCFVCIFLVLLRAVHHQFVLTKCLVYWIW